MRMAPEVSVISTDGGTGLTGRITGCAGPPTGVLTHGHTGINGKGLSTGGPDGIATIAPPIAVNSKTDGPKEGGRMNRRRLAGAGWIVRNVSNRMTRNLLTRRGPVTDATETLNNN